MRSHFATPCRAEACTAFLLHAAGESGATVLLGASFANQDGRSSSLTAPNGPSQQAVIRGALVAAALEPQQVGSLEMHGTGTALGDPIEVGAALAVFRGAADPLCLSASKSRLGHAEAAAGGVGAAHAAVLLYSSASSSVLHLQSMNPLVESLMQSHAGNGWPAPLPPRQNAQLSRKQAPASISAFAFQGTNAHVLLCHRTQHLSRESLLPVAASTSHLWRRQRFWHMARPHALLQLASKASRHGVSVTTEMLVPKLAYLQDHQIRGRALLPGAAMYETAFALGRTVLEHKGVELVLSRATIDSPCLLKMSGSVLSASVNISSGDIAISSLAIKGSLLHMQGSVGESNLADDPACSLAAGGLWLHSSRFRAGLCLFPALRDFTSYVVAEVLQPRAGQQGMYFTHPAKADNVTQAATALEQPKQAGQQKTFIPVGLEGYAGPFSFPALLPLWNYWRRQSNLR